ncbi:protein timeless-like [Artemia franciscana]|uniref:protein timeless-like n=1 Tax=Artemia franciscana TaxID=6661 RepID=UPI0032DBE194
MAEETAEEAAQRVNAKRLAAKERKTSQKHRLESETDENKDFDEKEVNELKNALLATRNELEKEKEASNDLIQQVSSLKDDDCESINDALLLLRNILSIPDIPYFTSAGITTPSATCKSKITDGSSVDSNGSSRSSSEPKVGFSASNYRSFNPVIKQCLSHEVIQHNQLLWNLFAYGLDKRLLQLMTCKKTEWSVTLVQVIALLYKDQHVDNLQKMLSAWTAEDTSSATSDDESNTSPQGNNNQSMDFSSASSANSGCNSNDIQDGENSTASREDLSPKDKNSPESIPSPELMEQGFQDRSSPKISCDIQNMNRNVPVCLGNIEIMESTSSDSDNVRTKRRSSSKLMKIPRTSEDICRRKVTKRHKTTSARKWAVKTDWNTIDLNTHHAVLDENLAKITFPVITAESIDSRS